MKKHSQTKYYLKAIILFFSAIILFIISCTENNPSKENTLSKIIPLPDLLNEIQPSDLAPILEMLGDAKIIGLTEGSHDLNEPLDFRNQLIKYLVKERRIDVVAIESGIVESKILYDYINGEKGNIDSILFYGISWTLDKLPQNKELVEWLRKYNNDSTNNHKVKLYGFDVSGSPANPVANRKMNTAIIEALNYLKIVDSVKWEYFKNRLNPFVEYLHINFFVPDDSSKQYNQLVESDRNKLTGIINDLINLYEINEINYSQKSTKEDYQWAYRAAICSRQIDNWCRAIPLNYKIPLSIEDVFSSNFFWNLQDKRDRSMADNLDWIIKRENEPKILLFAHIGHLSKSANIVIAKDSSLNIQMDVFGQYLSTRFGDEYKIIGNYYLKSKSDKDSTEVNDDAFENFLIHDNYKNYYKLITEADKVFMNKEWKFGEDMFNLSFYMNPYQGVDVIFFNQIQTQVIN